MTLPAQPAPTATTASEPARPGPARPGALPSGPASSGPASARALPSRSGPPSRLQEGAQCPLCRLVPAPDTLRCPGCQEDLAPPVHLRLRGRLCYNEGLRLARAGAYRDAVVELEQAVRLEPGLVVAWVVLGKAEAALGDPARAAAAFGRALRLDPDHAGAGAALAALPGAPAH